MSKLKLTENNIKNAIADSISIADVLKKLNMSVSTSNYKSFHKAVKKYNIDTSHFLGQLHLLGKDSSNKTIPFDEMLVINSNYLGIAQLKKRLIKSGLLRYECYECQIATWQGKKLSLQLDHINGIHNDHRIENLRLLCPNCHSQTDTFCGKNKKTYSESRLLCECGAPKHKDSDNCRKCAGKKKERIMWPEHDKLSNMVENQGYSKTAKELGVSRTAIVDRLKTYGALPVI